MGWAERFDVDEISQAEDGIAWLLKTSASSQAVALRDFIATNDPVGTGGTMFLHEDADQPLPGEIAIEDTPCLIMAPAALPVELWNATQARVEHSVALLGFLGARTSRDLNRFIMLTLRALFERSGRIPDTTAGHDPTTNHLDFVDGMRVAGPVQRSPATPLSRSQEGDLDLGGIEGYRWWGFRVLLAVRMQAQLLGG